MFKLTLVFVSIALTLQSVACRPSVEAPTGPVGETEGSLASGGLGFKEDKAEFVGFHGRSSHTASFWENQGALTYDASFPIPGGYAVLGYTLGKVLDLCFSRFSALTFADESAQANNGMKPKVCATYAQSGKDWRNDINKVFFPENPGLIGDPSDSAAHTKLEDARTEYINIVRPDAEDPSTVRFALSDQKAKSGLMGLPFQMMQMFSAKCFTYDGKTLPAGVHGGFTTFSYNSQRIRSEWKITPENEDAAKEATTS
ncbi:hypothetical protein CPB84DRAFT_1852348 [Gymnopilus junonius]|uniref:Uncharacterized protein n=1 Tax=Gymnopilus junonius TaxID=109634 RepID=A0A9P5NBY4_GYMJU|nr:hypothetical protein CPB84DRAFT_1852348 [Gymnopilus junonius]